MSGKPVIKLSEAEAAVYIGSDFTTVNRTAMLNGILTEHPETELVGSPIHLTGEVQSVNLVADRSITLSFALILPDEAFLYHTQGMYDTYVNAVLSKQAMEGNSLMTAYLNLSEKLNETGLEYESYLQNMGRQLFYTVASIYITLYLAIVFLVVANTIVGVQFLMSQQKTGRRYQTLIRLGATYESLCQSARKQISWFMGLPVLVAAVSSLFGVRALFTGILSSRTRGTVSEMLLDLVILDLNLPEISGFQICQELKNKTAIPVLVLTSRDQVKDELQAFQLGADEYLTKPCRKDRLLARVSNILKRYEGRTNLIEGLDFLLDQQTYTLYIHNTSVVLPKNQGKLLVALLASGDALVTTEQLCLALWGTTEYIDENALQVNLTRLKKTMSGLEMKQRIVAVRGMGYRLEAEVSP